MTSALEVGATAANAASVFLAARNSVHTWWVGIVGCALFGVVFLATRLYADALLQGFFVVTSVLGWWQWLAGGSDGGALRVTRETWQHIVQFALAATGVALC